MKIRCIPLPSPTKAHFTLLSQLATPHTCSVPRALGALGRHFAAIAIAASPMVFVSCTQGEVESGPAAVEDAEDSRKGITTPSVDGGTDLRKGAANVQDSQMAPNRLPATPVPPAADGPLDSTGQSADTSDGDASPPGEGSPLDDALPIAFCESPLPPYSDDVDNTVGDGSPESCTQEALQEAVSTGGRIGFECGSAPVTIALSASLEPRTDRDTYIIGGGRVTLDAQRRTRHFYLSHPDWQSHDRKLVLQGLRLVNGRAETGDYFPPLDDPQCAYGYKEGSGGAVYLRDWNLEVIDCVFTDNEAATLGPDVGGGAIYVVGGRRVVVSGSAFHNNRGANGGAIAMLHTTLDIFNAEFSHNSAQGKGLNFRVPEGGDCPTFNHESQGGAGGLAGAVYADGLDASGHVFTICGSRFEENRANEMGGALFRTPNRERREMLIDRSTFANNSAAKGGVSFIKDNHVVVRDSLFYGNRGGVDVEGQTSETDLGGLWINRGTIELINTTFHNNLPTGLVVDNRTTPGDDRPPSAGPQEAGMITNATFSSSAVIGNLNVRNTIFANTDCSEPMDGTRNLQWPDDEPACASDIRYLDPKLSVLDDHGGASLTQIPMASNLDFGEDCPNTDQRGEPRTGCVVGAAQP